MDDNKMLIIEDLNWQQKVDYEFYKKLGYNENQSILLAKYCLGLNYGPDSNIYKMIKHRYKKEGHGMSFPDFFVKYYYEAYDYYMAELEKNRKGVYDDCCTEECSFDSSSGFFGGASSKGIIRKTEKMRKGGSSPELLSVNCISVQKSISTNGAVNFECGSDAWNESLAFPNFNNSCDTESYHKIEESGFQLVELSPTSSFKTTCNTAAMGTLMNQIRNGRQVKPSSVRIEELMNFFDYDIDDAKEDKFNIHLELCDKPNSKNKILFVGLKGKKEYIDKQNIVILLDVSGSMCRNANIMQKTIMTIVSKLNNGDVLSLITYSSKDHTIFKGLQFNKSCVDEIIDCVHSIVIEGCTNGSAGIETAYKFAKKYYIDGGLNKVVLITDGDLNFGINSNDGLEKLILEKKKTGVFLSVVGMGIGNYKDDKLETLAKNGNGNYCVVNSDFEVEENIAKRYDKMMHTIAKDVKAQVEFNPAKVKSYRLLGYENREISSTEFNDDKVIAEPFGSGSECVALYELEMVNGGSQTQTHGLKYQTKQLVDSDEICTVSIRYKLPLEENSILMSKSLDKIGEFSDNIKLAFVCYAIGEKFRSSKFDDLKDKLMARYIAETFSSEKLNMLNEDKLLLLQKLANLL